MTTISSHHKKRARGPTPGQRAATSRARVSGCRGCDYCDSVLEIQHTIRNEYHDDVTVTARGAGPKPQLNPGLRRSAGPDHGRQSGLTVTVRTRAPGPACRPGCSQPEAASLRLPGP